MNHRFDDLRFSDYSDKFKTLRMRREDGILEVTVHTDGDTLQWSLLPHGELERAFHAIGRDRENLLVIITGAGRDFSGPRLGESGHVHVREPITPLAWDHIYREGKSLLMSLLDIPVPVISAINGSAYRHAEIPLMSDIVIASEDAEFQDSAHYNGGLVPGDGVHILFPLLMGLNRARYFLLTGQTLDAAEALRIGLINEVLPKAQVLPRAWELARQLLRKPALVRQYSRVLLTHDLKKRLLDLHGYGLALEGLAATSLVR